MTEPVYMYGQSTNKEEFQKFLLKIKEKVKADLAHTKPILYIDGAPAHSSHESMTEMSKHFTPLLAVPYSSEFNAIETLWSVSKNNYAKL